MGRRGPAPLPTAVAKRRGYKPRAGRRPKGKEPTPPQTAPSSPNTLDGDPHAQRCWKRLLPKLQSMKVLTAADGLALEGLCKTYSLMMAARDSITEHGALMKRYDGTLVANPAVRMQQDAWKLLLKFAQEFGLTPSSRTRVREVGDIDMSSEQKAHDSAEAFLFGGSKQVSNGGRIVGSIKSR